MSADQTAQAQQSPQSAQAPHTPQTPQSAQSLTLPKNLKIESTDIKTETGLQLNEQQRVIIGSVLDLFKGKPSLPKLRLWDQTATFKDPLTTAKGYDKFAPQWYGLATAFSEIEQLDHEVKDNGNPIKLDLKTRYVVKGTNTEKIIQSRIEIETKDNLITRLEDQWDGEIKESGLKNVSLFRPWSFVELYGNILFWAFSFVWDTRLWTALRMLNANSVPLMVKVPKTDEEDAQMGNQ
ncbi:MAG: hypothetical protein Q9159_004944 [Coniocarpon cinnabarinum]